MNKIEILIIEDDIEEAYILEEFLISNEFSVVGKVNTTEDALKFLETKPFDLAIVDIHLDGKPDGLLIAEAIQNKYKQQKPFLFLTGASKRSDFNKAKSLGPHGYLLKPFNELELTYAIELIIEKYNKIENRLNNALAKNHLPLLIKKNGIFYKIEKEDIIYVEVDGRYCSIITSKTNFLVQSSLDDFLNKLPEDTFIRTHRKYVINSDAIEQIHLSDNLIVLRGDKKVLLGRAYKNDFINKYNIIK
ncbi:LytR/AlgR family response regulator transcription factor [Pontimicrobium sp. MEBiC01747]